MPKSCLITEASLYKSFMENYQITSHEQPNVIRMSCKKIPRYRAIDYSYFNLIKVYARSISMRHWGKPGKAIPLLLFDGGQVAKFIESSELSLSSIYAWLIVINSRFNTALDISRPIELQNKYGQKIAYPCISCVTYSDNSRKDFDSLVAFILTIRSFLK